MHDYPQNLFFSPILQLVVYVYEVSCRYNTSRMDEIFIDIDSLTEPNLPSTVSMESKQCMPDEIRASWLLTSARLIRRWVVRAWIFLLCHCVLSDIKCNPKYQLIRNRNVNNSINSVNKP